MKFQGKKLTFESTPSFLTFGGARTFKESPLCGPRDDCASLRVTECFRFLLNSAFMMLTKSLQSK